MARLTILEYPDPRLRKRAQPVTDFGAGLQRLIDDLFETLYSARAIGLAATQVDVHQKVIVIDVSGTASDPQVFVNPEILASNGLGVVEEGCLSLPGVTDNVRRALGVRVRCDDRSGASCERDLEGLLAVCLQHEMDHLLGKLFIDRLSLLRQLRIRLQHGRKLRPPSVGASHGEVRQGR